MTPFQILYEDNHLLVVNKPADMPTMGDEQHGTLHQAACEYLRRKYHKPGRVFLGIVSRLDRMTSGVIVMARTSKAAGRLSDQFAGRKKNQRPRKIYLAAIEGVLDKPQGQWTDQLWKDDAARRMRIARTPRDDSQEATLRYVTLHSTPRHSVLAVELISGRKHQIRVQCSDRGHPILGDRKYAANHPFSRGIALHSWRLQLSHPTLKEAMWFQAEPPASWQTLENLLPPGTARWGAIESQLEQLSHDYD